MAYPARKEHSSSARSGSSRHWRSLGGAAGQGPDGKAAANRFAAGTIRRGIRYRYGGPPRQLPQAFSHLALIEAAARIIVAEMLEERS